MIQKKPLSTAGQLLCCLLLISACLGTSLYAQTTGAGTITGTITDPTGAVVPSAGVAVKNTATQAERVLATNEAGIFVAQFLQPGSYEITVTKSGFAKTVRTGLTLQVGQSLTVDLAMAVQTTSETVTVSGEAPIVDTEKTEMSQGNSFVVKDLFTDFKRHDLGTNFIALNRIDRKVKVKQTPEPAL